MYTYNTKLLVVFTSMKLLSFKLVFCQVNWYNYKFITNSSNTAVFIYLHAQVHHNIKCKDIPIFICKYFFLYIKKYRVFRIYKLKSLLNSCLPVFLQVKPQMLHFDESTFGDLESNIRDFWGQCKEAMMVGMHMKNREKGESKLKFQVSGGDIYLKNWTSAKSIFSDF